MGTATISPPELWSMTNAMADIFDRLEVPPLLHIAAMGRVKSLLKSGLIPDCTSRRGAKTKLTRAQYRRLLWGAFLTMCDIAPATVIRALALIPDDELVGNVIDFQFLSSFHGGCSTLTARLPRIAQ